MIRGKNIPNGLLRRATGGREGVQKSIGNLSISRERQQVIHKHDTQVSQFAKNTNNYEVNPPEIMTKNKSFTNGSQSQNSASLNAAKATMIKMMKEQSNHHPSQSQANNLYSQRNNH
jgi:hypothetical protein